MRLLAIALSFALIQCKPSVGPSKEIVLNTDTAVVDTPIQASDNVELSVLESKMKQAGLINVQWLNPNIAVDLKYSTLDNFLNTDLYGELEHAYLEENTAKKLAVAQHYLNTKNPDLSIKVWDAARPVSIQQRMWDVVDVPVDQKGRFVSNPKNHSLHNYGCAVDVTLIGKDNKELDMGTAFDQFDSLAQPKYEYLMLQRNKLSAQQLSNRKLLRTVMLESGFTAISSEWWHFNSCTRQFAKTNYVLLE